MLSIFEHLLLTEHPIQDRSWKPECFSVNKTIPQSTLFGLRATQSGTCRPSASFHTEAEEIDGKQTICSPDSVNCIELAIISESFPRFLHLLVLKELPSHSTYFHPSPFDTLFSASTPGNVETQEWQKIFCFGGSGVRLKISTCACLKLRYYILAYPEAHPGSQTK